MRASLLFRLVCVGFLLLWFACRPPQNDPGADKTIGLTAMVFGSKSDDGQGAPVMSYDEFLSSLYQEDAPDGPYIIDYDVPVADEKALRELYEAYLDAQNQMGNPNGLTVSQAFGVDNIWDPATRKNLTYCIADSFGAKKTRVKDTMVKAAAAWQAEADVKFVHVPAQDADCRAGNAKIVFDVRPVTSGKYLARAFFPNDARRYRNLMIDNTAFIEDEYSTLEGTLIHELGHTLGFRHEHTRPESKACFEDNEWRALTKYDPYSVMHYPQCNGKGNNLKMTAYDREGVRMVYGAPGAGAGGATKTETFAGHLTKGSRAYHGPFALKTGASITAVLSGTGDGDLYVRFGSKPTVSSYNCRPYLTGSDETCSLTGNGSDVYLMVLAGVLTDYDLKVTYVPR